MHMGSVRKIFFDSLTFLPHVVEEEAQTRDFLLSSHDILVLLFYYGTRIWVGAVSQRLNALIHFLGVQLRFAAILYFENTARFSLDLPFIILGSRWSRNRACRWLC